MSGDRDDALVDFVRGPDFQRELVDPLGVEPGEGRGDDADEPGRVSTPDEQRKTGPRDRVFVNVYEFDRRYGGPEEGGWWYDVRSIEKVYPTERRFAERVKTFLATGEYSNAGRRPLSSVASTGVYEVVVEETPGEDGPQGRPVYE